MSERAIEDVFRELEHFAWNLTSSKVVQLIQNSGSNLGQFLLSPHLSSPASACFLPRLVGAPIRLTGRLSPVIRVWRCKPFGHENVPNIFSARFERATRATIIARFRSGSAGPTRTFH